jgi:Glycosyl hydrolase catalytic core
VIRNRLARRIVAGAVTVGVLVGAAACGGGERRSRAGPAAGPAASVTRGHNPPTPTGRGPAPPDKGAWLGAWVKPEWGTPDGRAAAFTAFEQQVGAQLPIVHMFRDAGDEFPGAAETALMREADVLLLSWAGTDTRSIAQGTYDAEIRRRAEGVKALGVPLFLRFRWEMDRPNLAASVHSPEDYVAAWKRARRIFTEVGASNAAWVWCPHVQGFVDAERRAGDYYPGDDEVEWLCVDIYAGPKFEGFAAQMDTFMPFAQKHDKPIMVGEFGVTDRGSTGQRAAWLREARSYVKSHPQIKAMVYFAAKQDRKPVFDTTFVDDPEGLAAIREITGDPYFAAAPPRKGP